MRFYVTTATYAVAQTGTQKSVSHLFPNLKGPWGNRRTDRSDNIGRQTGGNFTKLTDRFP